MDFGHSIAIARELIAATRELQGYMGGSHDQRERRAVTKLIEALRLIYFQPVGLRLILRKLSQGQKPERADVEMLLPAFNDYEWHVHRRIELLTFDATADCARLPLRMRRILDEIAYGKRNLRRAIQEEVNEALTEDEHVDPNRAKELLIEVEALNSAIEAAEESLLAQM